MNEEFIGRAVYQTVQREHFRIVSRFDDDADRYAKPWLALVPEEKNMWIAVGKQAIAAADALRGEPAEAD